MLWGSVSDTQTMELCSSVYESATDEDMDTIERKVEVQEDLRCNTREWDRGRKNSINYISLITGSPDHNCRPFFHFVCPIHRQCRVARRWTSIWCLYCYATLWGRRRRMTSVLTISVIVHLSALLLSAEGYVSRPVR